MDRMDIAPFKGLRYDLERVRAADVTAPPYDVLSEAEHRALLERSPYNITHLTLGSEPGAASSYEDRARQLEEWVAAGVLIEDGAPRINVYEVEYTVPGTERRSRMLGFIALGKLHPFSDRIVLPHEETFPKVVEDRKKLLAATQANLESIFLLYSDVDGSIDSILETAAGGEPVLEVEAKPGEQHRLYALSDASDQSRLQELLATQRPIIADGHHRYTTSVLYSGEQRDAGATASGADWQMMTFTNLQSEGLSILATHRLLSLATGSPEQVLARLRERLAPAGEDDWHLCVETTGETLRLRFPDALLASRSGVARTGYSLLHQVVIADWLADLAGSEPRIAYYKEGTGETEALAEGRGDVLFRLQPVDREEFREVIEGGEVYPHKTTYFYPKLWSGLVVWRLAEPGGK